MQRELFKGAIVKERVVIKEYLARCLAVLRGGEGSLNAGQPHSGEKK